MDYCGGSCSASACFDSNEMRSYECYPSSHGYEGPVDNGDGGVDGIEGPSEEPTTTGTYMVKVRVNIGEKKKGRIHPKGHTDSSAFVKFMVDHEDEGPSWSEKMALFEGCDDFACPMAYTTFGPFEQEPHKVNLILEKKGEKIDSFLAGKMQMMVYMVGDSPSSAT